jgi:hypothetical protein
MLYSLLETLDHVRSTYKSSNLEKSVSLLLAVQAQLERESGFTGEQSMNVLGELSLHYLRLEYDLIHHRRELVPILVEKGAPNDKLKHELPTVDMLKVLADLFMDHFEPCTATPSSRS